MTTETVLYLLAGAAAGGFVNGLAGFGTALFALGWWLQVLAPIEAVALSLALSIAAGVPGLWMVRRDIEPWTIARFLLPALLGIPIGLWLLKRVDAGPLTVLVAALLLTYGVYFARRKELPVLSGDRPVSDGAVGLAGGVLGGLAGLSGALPTMWVALRPWTKQGRRALLQAYNLAVLSVAAILLWWAGGYGGRVPMALLLTLPVTLIAARAGMAVFQRLDDQQFRRLLVLLMLASGCVLLIRRALWM
ncbi:MAG: sulfite exporter TauE/SafE family protein [Pseudomonadota bacterium]